MTTATYTVDGMSGVAVRLVMNGPSSLFIESRVALAPEVVREAVEIVGFHALARANTCPAPSSDTHSMSRTWRNLWAELG